MDEKNGHDNGQTKFATVSLPFASWRFKHLFFPVLILLLAACGGLGSEPQIVASLPPETPLPQDVGYPVTPPDMREGAALFAQHCTQCHGAAGAGDGTLVQSGQVPNPGNFQDATLARSQTPRQWFDTVTNGRIEQLMPPWRGTLTEEQRWAVSLYTYTLHYTPEALSQGEALWAGCEGCPDVRDQAQMVTMSDAALYDAITEAVSETTSEADRYAMVAYGRALSLENSDAIGYEQIAQPTAATTAEALAESTEVASGTITINGQVTNGTAGSSVPDGLELALFVFTPDFTQEQFATTAGEAGAYSFADIPFQADATYVVTTAYRDRVFTSALAQGSQLSNPASLPLTIYELTEDSSVISIAGLVTQVNVTDEGLEVAQVFNVVNTSDRAFSTSQTTPDGRPISLVLPLPPGAIVPGFEEQGRYVFVQEAFTVFDTLPVVPGQEHLVQLIYFVSYGGDAIMEQPLNYATNGPVRLLVRPESVRVVSEQMPARGVETLGSTQYAAYGADLSLPAGEVLRYELSGQGGASAVVSATSNVVSSDNLLPVVLAILGVVVLLIAVLIGLQRRQPKTVPSGRASLSVRDTLVAQIAELDALYEAGSIEETDYQRQRTALKAQLADVMRRQDE